MKGIFLTEEGKKEIEDRIIRLESINMYSSSINQIHQNEVLIATYTDILKVSTIITVEESWEDVEHIFDYDIIKLEKNYPKGVIIKS